MLIVTLVIGLGLTFLGIPHGWLLGLLAGLCNLIPYLGPLLGAGVGAIVMISSGVDWHDFAWAMGAYLAAQAVDNVFTQPVIFAKRVFAHPLEIFVVISVAGSLAGPAGMVLAIPTYTLFRIVATEFFQEFPWIQALTQSMSAREQADGEGHCECSVNNSKPFGAGRRDAQEASWSTFESRNYGTCLFQPLPPPQTPSQAGATAATSLSRGE